MKRKSLPLITEQASRPSLKKDFDVSLASINVQEYFDFGKPHLRDKGFIQKWRGHLGKESESEPMKAVEDDCC